MVVEIIKNFNIKELQYFKGKNVESMTNKKR